ncbi:Holliday junction branch migration protein RuvA [Sphingobacteriales bacterium UPWRP_1]|nr:Holliday junction branch migration protein RuvA [Sphingobacteriales bacterium TSM_CSS]PSJ78384.1 Holliday junction branch migration protein RuvA [Sphingobacteriales bacterium UPWRP_1]
MIAYIKGQLTQKTPAYVVIETTDGVGYHVNISLHTFTQIQQADTCKLHTHLHIKEDAHTLYGFADETEKNLFQHLISVSGIGPATAQIMLSSLNPAEIQEAIITENEAVIRTMKGVGPKTAKRVILELKDKLIKLPVSVSIAEIAGSGPAATVKEDALTALLSLGIAKPMAQRAIARVLRENADISSVEMLIKQALQAL